MKKLIVCLALIAGLSNNEVVFAQQGSRTAAPMTNEKDAKMMSEIMGTNMYIMMLGKLASLKATSVDLRKAGDMISTDHQRFDAMLTSAANRQNFAIDPDLREKYTAKMAKYDSKATGAEWDNDIVEELVDLHKDGIDMLQDAMNDAKAEEAKSMIASTIKVMQSHMDILVPLKESVKEVTGATSTPPVTGQVLDHTAMKNDSKDAKFVSDMMEANTYEMRLMELILKKAQSRDLKNAAQHMLEDHSKMHERLTVYASTKGYGINAEDGADMNEKLAKWETKRGGMEWDSDLVEELNDLHKDGIDMLQDARGDAKDPAFVALINDTLPVMEMHRTMLDGLKDKVKKPWEDKKK